MITKVNRKITADTALQFPKYFGTSAEFRIRLQKDFDVEEEQIKLGNELREIPPVN